MSEVETETSVKITVDGVEIDARPDELVIDAAERHGTYIPRFCYHPRMNPVGMCRMCIVEIDTELSRRRQNRGANRKMAPLARWGKDHQWITAHLRRPYTLGANIAMHRRCERRSAAKNAAGASFSVRGCHSGV